MPLPSDDQALIKYDDELDYNPNASILAGRVTDVSQQQLANAAIIYRVGMAMGLSARDIQIGLITAMVESNLINVDHGDRDSLGLFQQRPSQGWGTPEQVMDPEYAARKFFTTLVGLGDKRFQMPMGDAAQAVQRSAYPDRYAKMLLPVRKMWASVEAAAGKQPESLDGGPYFPGYTNILTEYADRLAPQTLTSLTDAVEAGPVPISTEDMLGAWGMGDQKTGVPGQQSLAPGPSTDFLDDIRPIINQATNAQVIAPMQQEVGDFAQGVDGWRKAVISAARTALGTPYTWGGNSLQGGVDCSGLIQQAFARIGITLPRVSYQQANYGRRVGIDALRPGDLVAWDNSSRNSGADHIALYIGNGQIIEAARPGTAVRIRSLGENEGAWGVQLNFDRR